MSWQYNIHGEKFARKNFTIRDTMRMKLKTRRLMCKLNRTAASYFFKTYYNYMFPSMKGKTIEITGKRK